MDLTSAIVDAILTDGDGTEQQSQRARRAYWSASDEQKKLVDDIFMSLTGWSFSTLLEQHGNDEDSPLTRPGGAVKITPDNDDSGYWTVYDNSGRVLCPELDTPEQAVEWAITNGFQNFILIPAGD